MALEVYGAAKGEKPDQPQVDYDALNKYVVETCKLQRAEPLVGVISVVTDLGTQKQNDAQYKLDAEDAALTVEQLNEKYAEGLKLWRDHEALLATADPKNPPKVPRGAIRKFESAYDSDAKAWKIHKFVPQDARQSIAIAVDFPDIMLDKGKFFGATESEPKPLRLWLGGQYWNKTLKKMLIQNVIPLKEIKDDKRGWTLNPKSTVYKMAVDAGIISDTEPFKSENVDALLGKSLQFKVQIFMNPDKNDPNKAYYTEKITYAAGLGRGQAPRTLAETFLIQFNQPNEPRALKELRGVVVNTIEQATNFEGSSMQKQLQEARSGGNAKPTAGATGTQPTATPVANNAPPAQPAQLDDQLPF